MEWACIASLSEVELVIGGLIGLIGLVLILSALYMFGHKLGFVQTVDLPCVILPEVISKLLCKDDFLKLPLVVVVLILGLVGLGGPFWYVNHKFPEDSVQFAQRTFTLKEVKAELENDYRIRIDLNSAAESFGVSKDFKADCACDLVEQICSYYKPALQCQKPEPRHYIISAPAQAGGRAPGS